LTSVFLTDIYTTTLTISTSLELYLYMDIQKIKRMNEWMTEDHNVNCPHFCVNPSLFTSKKASAREETVRYDWNLFLVALWTQLS